MLNNHGWGFRTYIIASSIILIFLILVAILVVRLYKGIEIVGQVSNDSISYSDIENNLNNLSIKYVNEYKEGKINDGVITVSTKTLLKENLINSEDLKLLDNGDTCTGYSLIKKNDEGILYSDSYIKCKYYTTSGYQSWRVE